MIPSSNSAAYMTPADSSTAGLAAEASALAPWFQNLHLPDGSQTAPQHALGDYPTFKWRDIASYIPEDLSGWTALDIGCNAGFYSIELAKRGALVTGLDHDPHFLRQARWASAQFGFEKRIELIEGQIYDIAAWDRQFDLVLFLGVFYHLRYPLLGLDLVAERTRKKLVFQTFTRPCEDVAVIPADFGIDERDRLLDPGWPTMAFIENRLAGDATNWWAPNHACAEALLRSSGFKVTARPAHEIYVCEPAGISAAASRSFDVKELRAATGANRFSSPD
jgi:tRNA (mo5U34)-methyltransferase